MMLVGDENRQVGNLRDAAELGRAQLWVQSEDL
jgi:hypothetical protein